ncbi:MAG TPA: methyltransferase domain-containing protein [Chitinophagaceae bacterium]|nr:methyltransferase domain-containing protein [Chitinophagaceae bacterium]
MDITELKRQKVITRHPWEIERVQVLIFLMNKYVPRVDHVADIGGGDAYVLKSLCKKNIGKKFTAVDTAYTVEVIEHIKDEKCAIHFYNEMPANLKADSILLMDVLEHCEDDNALLREAKDLATEYTTFFITVPAFQQLFSRHDVLLQHYRRYTENSLTALCKRNGFVVKESGYFFSSLLLIRVIQLFLEKLGFTNSKKSIDNWKGGNAITKLFCFFLKLDFFIGRTFSRLGIKLPGLSTYCICHPLP